MNRGIERLTGRFQVLEEKILEAEESISNLEKQAVRPADPCKPSCYKFVVRHFSAPLSPHGTGQRACPWQHPTLLPQQVVAVETELEVELLELQVDVEEELKILKRAVESEFEFLKVRRFASASS